MHFPGMAAITNARRYLHVNGFLRTRFEHDLRAAAKESVPLHLDLHRLEVVMAITYHHPL